MADAELPSRLEAQALASAGNAADAAAALIDAAAAVLLTNYNPYQVVHVLAASLGRHASRGPHMAIGPSGRMPDVDQAPAARRPAPAPIAPAIRPDTELDPLQPRDLLDEKAAATFANVHPRTLRRWRSAGLVRFYKTGTGRIRYREADLAIARDEAAGGVLACPN